MHITATCGNCQKKYKVDAQLGGKKVHCKNCGSSFTIPTAEELAGAAAKGAAPGRGAGTGHAPRPMAKAGKAPGKAASAKPAKAPPPEAESGEMDLAGDPPCPGCGKPLPPTNKICTACGYNRATKQKMQGAMTSGAAAPAKAGAKKPGAVSRGVQRESLADEDHDYRGFRLNKPYSQAFLNTVDTWVPKLAVFFIVGSLVLYFGLLWFSAISTSGASVIGRLVVITMALLLFWGIAIFTTLAITNKGIEIGAKIMKCELPEGRYSRLMATLLLPCFASMVILLVGGVGAAGLFGSGGAQLGAMLAVIGVAALAFVATSFFTFLFFFRLKWLEALVTYLFFGVSYFVGVVVSMAVLYGILYALARLGMAMQEATTGGGI
jgi:hypothetical protein